MMSKRIITHVSGHSGSLHNKIKLTKANTFAKLFALDGSIFKQRSTVFLSRHPRVFENKSQISPEILLFGTVFTCLGMSGSWIAEGGGNYFHFSNNCFCSKE